MALHELQHLLLYFMCKWKSEGWLRKMVWSHIRTRCIGTHRKYPADKHKLEKRRGWAEKGDKWTGAILCSLPPNESKGVIAPAQSDVTCPRQTLLSLCILQLSTNPLQLPSYHLVIWVCSSNYLGLLILISTYMRCLRGSPQAQGKPAGE